jgi:hypothetical protein
MVEPPWAPAWEERYWGFAKRQADFDSAMRGFFPRGAHAPQIAERAALARPAHDDTNAYYAAEVQSVRRPEIRSHVLCKPGRNNNRRLPPDIEFLAAKSPLRARRNSARIFRRLKAMHIKCMLWFESPGYYFPMCENSRHSRGLGGRAVSSGLSKGLPLPPAYHRLFWAWFAFGFPVSHEAP